MKSTPPPNDPFGPGGMYDTSRVTFADRLRCATFGHDVHDWGTHSGWCRRCQHGVMTRDRKTVLYYGRFHRGIPPKHLTNPAAR